MLHRQIMILVMGALTGGAVAGGCASSGRSNEQEIPLDQVPPAVMQSFQRDFPGATVEEAERETQRDGTVEYELEFRDRDGKAREVEYSATGEQLVVDD